MSEESQSPQAGAEATRASADPAAVALALTGASRERADAFLGDQRAMLHLQMEEMRERNPFELSHLHWQRFTDRMKAALQVMTVLVGLAGLAAVAILVWNAAQADGLVVKALSVPPRFTEMGISGEVVADDLMNHIVVIRDLAVANSLDSSKGVSRDHDDDIKVEIPETGISLGQVSHDLRLWLGHERRITGNLRAAADGALTLTIVLEGDDAFTVSGDADELGKLEQQAAEHVFAQVDPINHALYLLDSGRTAEAGAAAEHAAQAVTTKLEKADAYSFFSFATRIATGDMALAAARNRLALAVNPGAATPQVEIIRDSLITGHDEEGLAAARAIPKLREEDQVSTQRGFGFQQILYEGARERDLETGDFASALSRNCLALSCSLATQSLFDAIYTARLHDAAQSAGLIGTARAAGGATGLRLERAAVFRDLAAGDWQGAATSARAYAAILKADTHASPKLNALQVQTQVMPLLAYALSQGGDPAGAEAAIAATPGDCYTCILTRGLIAAKARQWGRADYWFTRAVAQGPSLPFAHEARGRSLLARGRPDDASAQFVLANSKGPHFADALEGWGEALMARNLSHQALAKFAEAANYAPNWGRLHLKWGEALFYAGKRDEAAKHFARAAALDLTPSEKAELREFSARHI